MTQARWTGTAPGRAVRLGTAMALVAVALPLLAAAEALTAGPAGATAAPATFVTTQGQDAVVAVNPATDAVLGTYPLGIPAGCNATSMAVTPNGQLAYITDFKCGEVSVFNTSTDQVVTTLTGIVSPVDVAVSPNGKEAYVASVGGDVYPITVATNTVGPAIAVGGVPAGIAVTWQTAYVTTGTANKVVPITTGTNTVGTAIALPAGSDPYGITLAPNDLTAYVADYGASTVTPINTQTDTAGSPIAVGASPTSVAINPDGTVALVTSQTTADLTEININTPDAPDTTATVPVAHPQYAVGITPNGAAAFATSYRGTTVMSFALNTTLTGTTVTAGPSVTTSGAPQGVASMPNPVVAWVANSIGDTVTPVNVATGVAGPSIPVGSYPTGIAVNPDDTMVVVASENTGNVTIISTVTDSVITTINRGLIQPWAVAISPNGLYAYVTDYMNNIPSGDQVEVINLTGGTPTLYNWFNTFTQGADDLQTTSLDPSTFFVVSGCYPSCNSDVNEVTDYQNVGPAVASTRSPLWLVIKPNGQSGYAADGSQGNETLTNHLYTFNPATQTFGAANISLNLSTPFAFANQALAISPDGSTLYAVGPGIGLRSVATATNTYQSTLLPTSRTTGGIAITPDGQTAIVTDDVANGAAAVNLATGTVGAVIPTGSDPWNVAMSSSTVDGEIYNP